MARKSAALLKSTPVKLDGISRALLSELQALTPAEGCEEPWKRYLAAVQGQEEASRRYDEIHRQVEKEGGTSSAPSYPAFEALGKEYDARVKSAFGALDVYLYAVEHKDDDVLPEQDELFDFVNASLEDKLDELLLSVQPGLLAYKVAQAIRKDAIEFEYQDLPFCNDHKED